MTEEQQNFEIYSGDTNNILITVTNLETNEPKDLDGSSIEWILYDPYSGEVLMTKTTTSGVSILGSGIFAVMLLPEDSLLIPPAVWYMHEAEVTDSLGIISTVTTGYVRVKGSKI